jgi:FkbH-like protein
MKISIASTSFVPPKLEAWSTLRKYGQLKFLNYGDISNFTEYGDVEISIIFLKDFIDYYDDSKNKLKKNKEKIDKIIKLLLSKKKNYKNYIISFSEYFYTNSIESSKKVEQTKELKEYFIKKIYTSINKKNNFFFLDIDEVFSNYGFVNCFDQRNFFLSRCYLSYFGIEKLAYHLSNIILRIYNSNKKVLILDCDNTLWGGVLGEDGADNILIGQDGLGLAFLEFQKAIIKIKNRGVILVLASKNNKSDVEKVFKYHKSMHIKHNDITTYKVNWNEKFKNILELSQDLFLGVNSFVFWDDNPIERKKVKLNLKDVEVVEPNVDISEWAKQLLELPSLSKFNISKDDLTKTKQYKNRDKFLLKKKIFKDEKQYLSTINIKPKIIKLNNSNISRAEQMTMKTNQFNMNIKRLNINELKKINSKKDVFLVHLQDDYGDHGIVSLVVLGETKNSTIIELFLMSCRIIGRFLENWILEKIREKSLKRKKKNIIVEYLKTERNDIALKFLKNNKFKKIDKKLIEEYLSNENLNKKYNYVQLSVKEKIDNTNIY